VEEDFRLAEIENLMLDLNFAEAEVVD